jgi:hypothetical protein
LKAFPSLLNRISAFFFLFSNVSIQWFSQVLRIDRYAHKYLRLRTAMVVVQCRPVWFFMGNEIIDSYVGNDDWFREVAGC